MAMPSSWEAREEALRKISSLIEEIKKLHDRSSYEAVTELAGEVVRLATEFFDAHDRYRSAVESAIGNPIDFDTEGSDSWKTSRDNLINLCIHIKKEIEYFGLPESRRETDGERADTETGDLQQATLTFKDSDGPIPGRELAEFLRFFGSAYSFGLNFRDTEPASISPGFRAEIIDILRRSLEERPPDGPGQSDHGGADLVIVRIRKESLMEIVLLCQISALTVAVIISGGTVNLIGMRFELPALGTGIVLLREALGFPVTSKQRMAALKSRMKHAEKAEKFEEVADRASETDKRAARSMRATHGKADAVEE